MLNFLKLRWHLCALVLLACACSAWWFYFSTAASKSDGSSRLSKRACPSLTASPFSMRCYYYRTHERGGFYLPMALLTGSSVPTQPRPLLVYIPGGPGQGYMTAADHAQYWADWMDVNNVGFDLLLFDPRGSGESIPTAHCRKYHRRVRELLGEDIPLSEEYDQLNTILRRCFSDYHERLEAHLPDGDTGSLYDVLATRQQALDIDGMLAALGYTQAHLWGVSYGTRYALLAAQSERVSSLILDSPYPFSAGQYSDWLALYERSFDLFETLYARLPREKKPTDDFRTLFRTAQNQLTTAPLEVSVQQWDSGRYQSLVLTPHRLLELSFSVLYSPHLYKAYFSGLAYLANTGKPPEEWKPVLEDFYNNIVDKHFSFLSYFAVECLDNQKEAHDDVVEKLTRAPDIADYFTTGLDFDICRDVGFSETYSVQNSVYTDKPTLIFSGQYDPVTPAERGEGLSQQLNNARFFLLENTGHGSLQNQNCDWTFIDRFIASGDVNMSIPCKTLAPTWP